MSTKPTTAGPRSEAELMADMNGLLREFNSNPNHPALIGKPDGNPVQIRPAFPEPAQLTNDWINGIANNKEKYVRGVQAPRANFKAAALAQKGAWKEGVTKAIADDAFAKGMSQVNEDEAIATAVAIGGDGLERGARARTAKHTRKMEKWRPLAAAAIETVRRMPAVTDADREKRSIEMQRAFKAGGKALRGG